MFWGHPIERIWKMTPRQAFAWMTLGSARTQRERAMTIGDTALAAQGEGKQIKAAVDELSGA